MNDEESSETQAAAPAIIVHGGALPISDEERPAYEAGCLRAAEAGWAVLEGGGNATDAVVAAVRVLEADPTFNAGYGSSLNADAMVEMDASVMEGSELKVGAVAAVQGVKHPVSIAHRLLASEEVLLVGHGARRVALDHSIDLCDPQELITEKKRQQWLQKHGGSHDTVGCVALDGKGVIATALSTGGLANQSPGRVGDSPVPGSGFYADNRRGGVAVSGDGEEVMRVNLARVTLDCLRLGLTPDAATKRAIEEMADRVGGEAGTILLTPEGQVGWAHNSSDFAVAYRTGAMPAPRAFTRKDQEAEVA